MTVGLYFKDQNVGSFLMLHQQEMEDGNQEEFCIGGKVLHTTQPELCCVKCSFSLIYQPANLHTNTNTCFTPSEPDTGDSSYPLAKKGRVITVSPYHSSPCVVSSALQLLQHVYERGVNLGGSRNPVSFKSDRDTYC